MLGNKELRFGKNYKKVLIEHEKTKTVRLGDKSEKYKIGDVLVFKIGDREVGKGAIVGVLVKKVGEIKDDDLIGESISYTKKKLLKRLNRAHFQELKRRVSDEDLVTIISWKFL